MNDTSPPQEESTPKKHVGLWWSLGIVIVIGILGSIAFIGWTKLYTVHLESVPPEIRVVSLPSGIGVSAAQLVIELRDTGAGLDEVVVRTKQRGPSREILRQTLKGKTTAKLTIDFPGEKSDLDEGDVEIDVRAFDRSFWNNRAGKVVSLKVDFRKPKLEVVSTQHNARRGGSQLIFYRVIDEDIAISGVKVGEEVYFGFPARGIDRDFEDPALFVALYGVDMRIPPSEAAVELFAEDKVGNRATTNFYNRITGRKERNIAIKLSEEFLRQSVARLADENFAKVEKHSTASGTPFSYRSATGTDERLIEQLRMVIEKLAPLNDSELSQLMEGPRFERLWEGSFMLPVGAVSSAFGDKITFEYGGREISSFLQTGYEVIPPRLNSDVYAANNGIVAFSENLGVYGRVISIDHGLGLFSVYAHLDQVFVKRGESVSKGQKIAKVGNSGLARSPQLYFEMRLHGVPVAPEEWWEAKWFFSHITAKINDVKQALGMQVLRPLDPR